MDFKINKQRANRVKELTHLRFDGFYESQMRHPDMVFVGVARKGIRDNSPIVYDFYFEWKKNQPYVGQVIMTDQNITKILEIIK